MSKSFVFLTLLRKASRALVWLEQSFVGFVDPLDGETSTSAVMLCAPQKSSISWVSAMPPMAEPARLRHPMIRPKAETPRGFAGAPTRVMLPSRRSRLR